MTTPGGKRKRPQHDPYDVLKLEPECGEKDIDRAYKKLALQWHPDKNPDRVEKANQMFLRIYEAYEFLKDAQARAEYDEEVTARKRRAEYDYHRKETNSKKRQELIDKLIKKETAAAAEKPSPSTTTPWRNSRRSGDSWWTPDSTGSSNRSQRRQAGYARVEEGDDEELERLKHEGAQMLRRDREEAERRLRAEGARMKQEAEKQFRDGVHYTKADYSIPTEEAAMGNGTSRQQSKPAASRESSQYSDNSNFEMSLDEFLRLEQEVLNYSTATRQQNEKDEDGERDKP